MRSTLIFIFSIIFITPAFLQTITVTDLETGQPLLMVTVMSKNPNAATVTNAKGQAEISEFKKAASIQFRMLGYKSVNLTYDDILKNGNKVQMEQTNVNLEEAVISATRWRENSGNLPYHISSISSKEVTLQNPQTAADLLGISGKVFIQKSQQGGGSPMIRGFATNRLLYSVDGIRMNTAIFREGNIQNVINLDPNAIENTEVLFGPCSVMYGSDAIGGVMSFQTLTPQLSLSNKMLVTGKANVRYSSANKEKSKHVDFNLGWKKWAFLTSFSNWNFDHLKQGSKGPDDYIKDYYVESVDKTDNIVSQKDPLLQIPSGYSQKNLMQKIRFRPNNVWDFQYGFHYSETSDYGRYDRHNRVKNGNPRYAEWNYGPQSWFMNNLNITHNNTSAFYNKLIIRLAQQSFDESRISRSFDKPERSINTEEVKAYSVNIDFMKQLFTNTICFYGFEYILNNVNSKGELLDIYDSQIKPGPARYPNADWSSTAVFLNSETEVGEKLTLLAGMRYNNYSLHANFSNNLTFYPFPYKESSLNEDAFTGSFGVVVRPQESWVIKLNASTGFRAPNIDDIGKVFDSEPGSVMVPNPDLQAEYAYNVDLGIAKVFYEVIKLELTSYYTLLNNALVRREFQLDGHDSILYDGMLSQVMAIQNAAEMNVYGIQGGVEIKLPVGFSLSSDLNHQVGEVTLYNGETGPSRHTAPMFGVTRFSFHKQKLIVQFYAQYQGERIHSDMPSEEIKKTEIYALDENGDTYAPAWYTLNIKAIVNFTQSLLLTAGIENITDQRYRPYSSGISAAGRNFILSLQYVM